MKYYSITEDNAGLKQAINTLEKHSKLITKKMLHDNRVAEEISNINETYQTSPYKELHTSEINRLNKILESINTS